MIKSKYKNVKIVDNGVKYDSKKEAAYAQTLDILKKAKGNDRVLGYKRQFIYEIFIGNTKICKYLLDFRVQYNNRIEYIDVKGFKTPVYKLKKKLVEAQYGITIKEV